MGHQIIGFLVLALICALTGCQSPPAPTVTVFGLWPEQPPLRYRPYNAWTGGNHYEWPQLDSTQPELRWEAFPRPGDLAADTNGCFAQFKSVAYDLRIWRGISERQLAGELVYARDALPKPCHRVEKFLPANSWYFWSVRARFDLIGQTRVSEWSLIMSPAPAPDSTAQRDGPNYPDARFFRFRIR